MLSWSAERMEGKMSIEIGLSKRNGNTQYAGLAALMAHYQQQQALAALGDVDVLMKVREYTVGEKLAQVMLSILAGCVTLAEVNSKLRSEELLAQSCGWPRIADQSSLSRTLNRLGQKQIEQLRHSTHTIYVAHSQAQQHDWRGYLWLDFDLSGLPSSAQAEGGEKGYFGDKKTAPDASWHVSVRSTTMKRCGQNSIPAAAIRFSACVQP
jgi:hypothetical protein